MMPYQSIRYIYLMQNRAKLMGAGCEFLKCSVERIFSEKAVGAYVGSFELQEGVVAFVHGMGVFYVS